MANLVLAIIPNLKIMLVNSKLWKVIHDSERVAGCSGPVYFRKRVFIKKVLLIDLLAKE